MPRTVRVSENNAEGYYSYFYVNDRKSSLGEFDNLLANARISADGYNFVQKQPYAIGTDGWRLLRQVFRPSRRA